MTAFLIIPFFLALLGGIPIAFSLALGVVCAIVFASRFPIEVLANNMYAATASFPLMAVPFFLLAGELMNRTGITTRLLRFVVVLVGRMHGGLGHSMVLTGTIFAGLSGSGAADTAALTKIMAPGMAKEGYPISYSAGLAAATGVLGPIIPPSICMIVYGALMNVSVGTMFMAGIMPGLLLAGGLMAMNSYMARKHHFPKCEDPFSFKELWVSFKGASLALLMPIFILYAIRGGICTPTEGGSLAAVYALFLGVVVYRTLSFKDCLDSLVAAGITSAVVLLVVGAATPFGWLLSVNRIPQEVATFILGLTQNKYVVLLLFNVLLLIMGMLLETNAIILLLAPILAPVAVSLGVHPIHFAVVMIVNLCIGLATPPVGMTLFVGASAAGITVERVIKQALPFVAVELVVLMVITYIPEVILCIPRALGMI
ncbi:MAG: TRAP transporter large permease [Mailhella sp.]|nr:TRAP transporter large permease [Mailhella sp.]